MIMNFGYTVIHYTCAVALHQLYTLFMPAILFKIAVSIDGFTYYPQTQIC